jgi:hypothetical protein
MILFLCGIKSSGIDDSMFRERNVCETLREMVDRRSSPSRVSKRSMQEHHGWGVLQAAVLFYFLRVGLSTSSFQCISSNSKHAIYMLFSANDAFHNKKFNIMALPCWKSFRNLKRKAPWIVHQATVTWNKEKAQSSWEDNMENTTYTKEPSKAVAKVRNWSELQF